jgi:flavin reductase (DIM6/NTAB) family NADH-FMN oxidoreductase RutF
MEAVVVRFPLAQAATRVANCDTLFLRYDHYDHHDGHNGQRRPGMDAEPFDDLMASLDAPMAVVTAAVSGERAGCLVGFHAQCSIHPPRYAVWLSKANHTFRVAMLSEHLGLHLLTEDDRPLAELFGTQTGDEVDKFARCDHYPGPGGVPLLTGCRNRLVLRRTALLDDGSDHVCMVGEPVAVINSGRLRPLRLHHVADLTPGHEVDERPRPPTERSGGPYGH